MRTVVPAVNLVHVPKPNLPKSTTQNHDRTVDAAQEKAAVLLAMQMGHLVAVVHPSGKLYIRSPWNAWKQTLIRGRR